MKHSFDGALKMDNAPLQAVRDLSDTIYERSYLTVAHTNLSEKRTPDYQEILQEINPTVTKAVNWDEAWFDNYE